LRTPGLLSAEQALELDDAQIEFTCHAMHCFMQAYLENLQ
jgi:hypothetical protein